MTLQEGDKAPEFSLPDHNGQNVSLSEMRGSKIVLYFYPKDDTSGCTKEACGIRDEFPSFQAKGAVVLGVSPDSAASHEKFRRKHDLPFILLVDTKHEVAEAYGVWVKKQMYGREYMGVARTTFVIDEQGNIECVFRKVSPAEHAQELLAALDS